MGRRKVTTYEIECDYPHHLPIKYLKLGKGASYHFVNNNYVICSYCWDNKMTVEALLDVINVSHKLTRVGDDE